MTLPLKNTELGLLYVIFSRIPGGTTVTLTSCYSAYYYMCAASMGAVRATPTDAPSGIQAGYIHVPHDDTTH